jgi:hypothetical protein
MEHMEDTLRATGLLGNHVSQIPEIRQAAMLTRRDHCMYARCSSFFSSNKYLGYPASITEIAAAQLTKEVAQINNSGLPLLSEVLNCLIRAGGLSLPASHPPSHWARELEFPQENNSTLVHVVWEILLGHLWNTKSFF